MGAFTAVALILIGIAAFCLIMCLRSRRRGKPTRVDEEAGAAKVVTSRPKNKATDSRKKRTAITEHRVDGEAASRRRVSDEAVARARRPTRIDYAALEDATNKFDGRAVLGEGHSGVVYKANLQDLYGEVCAVKKLSGEFKKKELDAELAAMRHVSHPNLVQLKGWCCHRPDLFLVYEYVPNFSLEEHLFRREEKKLPLLSWEKRYKIANGLVAGVLHLHTAGKNNKIVIHRDIKPSNIMLDQDFTPKLGDFGLARLTVDGKSMNTTVTGGTPGYIAPEIITPELTLLNGKASKESDVYSVGIVLLQIATGKRLRVPQRKSHIPLVIWVWFQLATNSILEAVDEKLCTDQFDNLQAIRLLVVGLWCCQFEASARPQMSEVLKVLNGGTRLSDVPLIPPKGYVEDSLNIFTTASHIKKNIKAVLKSEVPILDLLDSLGKSSKSSNNSSSSSKYCTPPTSMTSTERHAPAETMDEKRLRQIPE